MYIKVYYGIFVFTHYFLQNLLHVLIYRLPIPYIIHIIICIRSFLILFNYISCFECSYYLYFYTDNVIYLNIEVTGAGHRILEIERI